MGKAKISAVFQKHHWLWKAALMALLPPLCAGVACWVQGFRLDQVYLPASAWNENDELFYFKQVEAILHGGFPLGYFGYNEGHALTLSFGVWSPVLYLPWVLWGLLFGWTYSSPIYCNIALMSTALFCFVLLSRPTFPQMGAMAALFCLFFPGIRFMLSSMAESNCIALSIMFYGFAVGWLRHGEQGWKLAGMFSVAVFLTLVRPYMLFFLLLPVVLWIGKDRSLKRIAPAVSIPVLTLVCYALIGHYLQASYFTQSFSTDWIVAILHGDLAGGGRRMLDLILGQGRGIFIAVLRGLRRGALPGAIYVCFFAVLAAAVWIFLAALRRRDRPGLILYGHLILSFLGILAAICLLYQLPQGGRHILSFIGPGLLLVCLAEPRLPWKSALLAALFILLFPVLGRGTVEYAIPREDPGRTEALAYWTEALDRGMALEGDSPSYENTVLWVYTDYIPAKDSSPQTDWRDLYAVPAGFGINCCHGGYILEHFDTLRGRYIATVPGGRVDAMCQAAGFRDLGRHDGMVFYARY